MLSSPYRYEMRLGSATSSTVSAGFAAFYPRRSPLVPFQALPPPWLRAFYHITRNALAVVLSATTLQVQVVAEMVL